MPCGTRDFQAGTGQVCVTHSGSDRNDLERPDKQADYSAAHIRMDKICSNSKVLRHFKQRF
jgi:hypothetical protein